MPGSSSQQSRLTNASVSGGQPGLSGAAGVAAGASYANVSAPVVAGTPSLGSSPTITPGTWTGGPTLTYSLYRGGAPVAGAQGLSEAAAEAYTYDADDVAYSNTTPFEVAATVAEGNNPTITPGEWETPDLVWYEIPDGETDDQVAANTLNADAPALTYTLERDGSPVAGQEGVSEATAEGYAFVGADVYTNDTAPVVAGTVVVGNSPLITPGVWSNPDLTWLEIPAGEAGDAVTSDPLNGSAPTLTYTLEADAVEVSGQVGVSEATAEAFEFTEDEFGPELIWYEIPDGVDAVREASNALEARTEITFTTGLTSVNHWRRVADGPPGSSDMSVVVIWRKIIPGDIVGDLLLADRRNANGWTARLAAGSGTRLVSYVEDGSSATKFALTPIGAGLGTQVHRSVMTLSGGVLRHFHNGIQQGSDVAVTGYSPATTEDFFVGKATSGTPEMEVAAVIIGSGMTPAQVLAYDAYVAAGGDWTLPVTTDYLYDAADISGSTWAPQVGSGDLTAVGSPTVTTVTADWSPQHLINFQNDGNFIRTSEAALVDPRNGWAFDAATPWPGVNVRRVVSDGGLLVEESRTNVLINTQNMPSGFAILGSMTSLVSGLSDPSGGSNGSALGFTGISDGQNEAIDGVPNVTGDLTAALSVYAKNSLGFRFYYRDVANTVKRSTDITAGASWARHSRVVTDYDNRFGFNADVAQTSGDRHMYVPQAEAGAYPTSPIRTAGSATTRGPDRLYLDSANVQATLRTGKFRFDIWPSFSAADLNVTTPGVYYILYFAPTNYWILMFRRIGGGSGLSIFSSGAYDEIFTSATHTWNRHDKITVEIDHPTLTATGWINDVQTGTPVVFNSDASSGSDLSIGSTGSSLQFNGVIGRPYVAA